MESYHFDESNLEELSLLNKSEEELIIIDENNDLNEIEIKPDWVLI